MLSKAEPRLSLRRCTLAIIGVGAIVCWTSASALSQEVAVAEPTTNSRSTSSSLEGPESSDAAPHLEIVMVDRDDPLFHGSHLTNFHVQPAIGYQPIEKSQDRAGGKTYSQLDHPSIVGSFRYEDHKRELLPKQWSPDRESDTHDVQTARQPLFQVQLGDWRIPVLLSAGASE